MLGFFRSMFQSRIGVVVALAFLALIAIAFASADITGSSFGGIAGGDRVAVVGDRKIGTGALNQTVNAAFDRARQQDPSLTMERFIASGGARQVLDDMIDRGALAEFGASHGIAASDRLVDSEIAQIPAFVGPDGRFSQKAYQQAIAQQGLSDRIVREDLAIGLVANQLLMPVGFGAQAPEGLALRYAALSKERRRGEIALIPSAAFAPESPPSEEALTAFYNQNRTTYVRPERRVIRYAVFGEEALGNVAAPTEAEIAQAYAANRQAYAGSETRTITQVVLPTEAAATALVQEVRAGASLAAAARSKGLLPSTASVTREALAGQASAAVAQSVFSTSEGGIAGPARSGLGWHVARVDAVRSEAGKSLAQARDEIAAQLVAEKRRNALSDFAARIEEQFEEGANLAEVAREFGLQVRSSEPLLADGRVWGKPTETAPPELARVLATAFLMEDENEPQLAEVEPGKRFALFDVEEITPAAPPPLAEISDQVAQDWALAQGSTRAKAAADKVVAAVAKGTGLAEALRAVSAQIPAPQRIQLGRQELLAAEGQVPPPLSLMFNMAQGTAKRLEGPGRQGWFVVKLDEIVPGNVSAGDQEVAALRRELGQVIGGEYVDQFRRAVRREVRVERNDTAIQAVEKQLSGSGQ